MTGRLLMNLRESSDKAIKLKRSRDLNKMFKVQLKIFNIIYLLFCSEPTLFVGSGSMGEQFAYDD